MRREDKYILGTAREIAEYITDESFRFLRYDYPQGNLKPYDFAIAEMEDGQTLEEIKDSSSGWYGIKQIETGFDSCGIDLFADYYGGYCGHYGYLDYDYNRDDCIKIITEMILNTLHIQESCDEDTILIAEPAEEAK